MPIQKSKYIWFNGELVPWDDAQIHVSVHALHYGSSVFEGIRAYETPRGPAVLGLQPHVRRLFDSCRLLRYEVPYTQEEIEAAIIATVRENEHKACYIRPLVFLGSETMNLDARTVPVEVLVMTIEWGRYLGAEGIEKGIDVQVSTWRRIAPSTLMTMAKAGGNYINSQMIVREAKENGFAEGIALDVNGYVSEGSGENIFVIRNGEIYTPPMGASILPGITRGYIITLAREMGYTVREEMLPREMLYIADEIFMTGTAAEVTPIRSVDRVTIGNGSRGPSTKELQTAFFEIVSGQREDRHGWLTLVKE